MFSPADAALERLDRALARVSEPTKGRLQRSQVTQTSIVEAGLAMAWEAMDRLTARLVNSSPSN